MDDGPFSAIKTTPIEVTETSERFKLLNIPSQYRYGNVASLFNRRVEIISNHHADEVIKEEFYHTTFKPK